MNFVFFHAHPDDEAVATAGTMCALTEAGHRVVVVFATGGEEGLRPADVPDPTALGRRRAVEAQAAADILGVARVVFLGYADSGEDPHRLDPDCFASCDPVEAAGRLVEVVWAETAGALIAYDQTGTTLHPDHVQVHRVARAAVEQLPDLPLYESVLSETQRREFVNAIAALLGVDPADPQLAATGPTLRARPDAEVTLRVDARRWADRKRAAMAAHASQIGPESFFLALEEAEFVRVFGSESYIDPMASARGAGPLEAALADLGVAS